MSAISSNAVVNLWPQALEFSFFEIRAPECLYINPRFVSEGIGVWRYTEGKTEFRMTLPSWDRNFDWDAHYKSVLLRHKPANFW